MRREVLRILHRVLNMFVTHQNPMSAITRRPENVRRLTLNVIEACVCLIGITLIGVQVEVEDQFRRNVGRNMKFGCHWCLFILVR